MSIFPKRTIKGKKIILHTALNYKGSPKLVSSKSSIINPLGKIAETIKKDYFYFPKNKHNYLEEKEQYLRGHSGLVYAHFFRNNFGKFGQFEGLFEKLSTSSHNFTEIKIGESYLPGRYQVKSNFLVNGFGLDSDTIESDLFFVDQLEFIIENNKAVLVNKSPEVTPFRIHYYDQNESKEYVSVISGNSKMEIPKIIDIKNAFLIYAEDQKIEPLFKELIVYRNPSVKFLIRKSSSLLNLNDDNAFEIKDGLHDLWTNLQGFRNRGFLIEKFGKNNYDKLLNNKLICEQHVHDIL